MTEYVQLVDEQDKETGTMEKIEAHRKGELHRAISVFIINSKGEMLLQKRAGTKYHSAGLWSNACCTHPRPGEDNIGAAKRRLVEEMGIDCDLAPAFSLIYRAELDRGLTEHEYDHIFTGVSDAQPVCDPEEVSDYRYIALAELDELLETDPDRFTVWFRLLYNDVKKRL